MCRLFNGIIMGFLFQTAERNFPTLTAMTGVIEVDLNRFMTEKGVTMLSQPLNDVESFGGMVAAATHVSQSMFMTSLRVFPTPG